MCIIGHSITRYRPDYARLARNYCELGASDAKLAKFFAVSPVTLALWIADIPEFADAVREGRLAADAEVAESLHQRAVGWHETVERVLWRRDKPVTVTYTRQHPPHVGAAITWLENRRPQNWSRRPGKETDVGMLLELAEVQMLPDAALLAMQAVMRSSSAETAQTAQTQKIVEKQASDDGSPEPSQTAETGGNCNIRPANQAKTTTGNTGNSWPPFACRDPTSPSGPELGHGLADRHRVGDHGIALCRGDGERPELARAHELGRRGEIVEVKLGDARRQVLKRGARRRDRGCARPLCR
jgi:hypothetical protein